MNEGLETLMLQNDTFELSDGGGSGSAAAVMLRDKTPFFSMYLGDGGGD